jgi:hypothetical protein
MKIPNKILAGAFFSAAAMLSMSSHAAGTLTYTNSNLDAMLCFRQLGAANPLDLEVNIGSITNYASLAVGTTVSINQYTVSQLTNAIGVSTFDNVEFSVTAAASEGEPVNFAFPLDTVWVTRARSNPANQSSSFARASDAALSATGTKIDTLGNQAAEYSAPRLTDPLVNTSTAVAIPPANSQSCESSIGPGNNSKLGGTFAVAIENRAPSPFTSAIVSDLYVDVPAGDLDPANGNATSGNASFLGFFTFNPNGTMTFTRAAVTAPLPPKPTLTVSRNGNVNTISFQTTSTATYTLFFTNSAGLSAHITNWPSKPSFKGDGAMDQVTDTTTDTNRFYVVSAHN